MKKDTPFAAFLEPRRTRRSRISDPPLRVAKSPEGIYGLLPGAEDAPEPAVIPAFEDRDTAIALARLCMALGIDELEPPED